MRLYLIFAAWSLLAGAGIPLIGVLNSGVARSVGNPFAATAVMFAMATIVAFGITPALRPSTVAQTGISTPSKLWRGPTYWLLWIIRHNHYPAFRRGQFHRIHSDCSASCLCGG